MIRNVLSDAAALGLFPAFALVLFFVFFVGVTVWALRLKRSHVDAMGRLPLENDDANEGATRHD